MTKSIKKLLLADKRKTNRLFVPLKTFYCVPPSRLWLGPLIIEDISGGGLKFKSKTVFERGKEISLKIDLRDKEEPIMVKASVNWCRESHIPDVYNIGVTFVMMEPRDQRRFFEYLCDCILLSHINTKGGIIS